MAYNFTIQYAYFISSGDFDAEIKKYGKAMLSSLIARNHSLRNDLPNLELAIRADFQNKRIRQIVDLEEGLGL